MGWLDRFSKLSLVICTNQSSPLVGPLDGIQCPYWADKYKFLLVGQLWCALEKVVLSSSLLLQQFSACITHLSRRVYEMGGKWPYIRCFVGCCFPDSFKTASLCRFYQTFSFKNFIKVQVVQLYASNELDVLIHQRSDFHIVNNVSIVVHVLHVCVDITFSRWNMATEVYELVF